MKMGNEIKNKDERDVVIETITGLCERIEVMLRLYPRATKEIFNANNLSLEKDTWKNKKYSQEELREITLAQVTVDKTKQKYDR